MMRTRTGLMLVVPLLLLNTSFSQPPRPGILTDDFGIVTQEDIDQENAVVRIPIPFKVPTVFPYWRCLRPEEIEMDCEGTGTEEPPGNLIAAPRLTIIENGEKYEYHTRRPWGVDACEETLSSWRNVIGSETVFCVSATVDEVNESPVAAPWDKVTYGEINRMKSYSGQWSYFIDEGQENIGQ